MTLICGQCLFLSMLLVAPACPSLSIAFGRAPSAGFDVGVPVLAGEGRDDLFPNAQPAGRIGAVARFSTDDWLLGGVAVPMTGKLEEAAQEVYRDVLRATAGHHLARIWNFVPAINAVTADAGGLENYRAFCRGRARAFEERHGAEFAACVPAASAVGCDSPRLTVAFAATRAAPRHVENPAQMPAYDYPADYGPRSPSFARATVVPGRGGSTVFISGTASIRGHATIAPDGLAGQLDCTLENLAGISRACGLGPHLAQGGGAARFFKVYLRRVEDHPFVAAILAERLFVPGDRVTYLRADICRQPLLVEIEVSLFGVADAAQAGGSGQQRE